MYYSIIDKKPKKQGSSDFPVAWLLPIKRLEATCPLRNMYSNNIN